MVMRTERTAGRSELAGAVSFPACPQPARRAGKSAAARMIVVFSTEHLLRDHRLKEHIGSASGGAKGAARHQDGVHAPRRHYALQRRASPPAATLALSLRMPRRRPRAVRVARHLPPPRAQVRDDRARATLRRRPPGFYTQLRSAWLRRRAPAAHAA